jgi:predicted phage terminase large subunit-like protein
MTTAPIKTPAALPSLLDIKREVCRRSFYHFFVQFFEVMEPAEPYVDTWHVKVICDHAQAWVEGRVRNLSIEIGPGFMKSLIMAVALPAWAWVDRPWMRFGYSTYSGDLTERDSARCRELIQSALYQEYYGYIYSLKKDRNQIKFFENTKGGNRRATSVSGGATGHRVHRFVGDDLLNATEAHSAATRRDVYNHLRAFQSRGVNQKTYGRCIIGQRLHEEDAGGYARAHGFEVLCLPTEYDPTRACQTSIGFKDPRTYPGQLLFPGRFDADEVASAKSELGPYGYSAQHQQLPVPAGGGILKRIWWLDYVFSKTPQFHTVFQAWDTAYTSKEANDTSACVTFGVAIGGIYVLDAKAFRLETPQLLDQMQIEADLAQQRWRHLDLVLIEAKANGLSLIHTLGQSSAWKWRIEPINTTLNKTERAQAVAPYVARGLALVPTTQPFVEELLAQTDVFPNAKLRDLADACIQGLLYAFNLYTFGTASAPAFVDMKGDKPASTPPTTTANSFYTPMPDHGCGEDERTGLY